MVKDPVASLDVVAITPEGRQVSLAVRIGKPARAESGYACPVEISPIYGELADIRGVDSFHALWLACSLVLKLLAHFKQTGGRLLDTEGNEFPIDGYLSGLGGKEP